MKGNPYTINGSIVRGSTVVKIFYGKSKYVVVKCKKEYDSIKSIEKQLASFLRGGKRNEGSMYIHLFDYVKSNPGGSFRVKLILESESPYELLKAEQSALKEGRKDPNMLNNNIEAYIPQFDADSGYYGWLSKADVMNFKRWIKAHKNR